MEMKGGNDIHLLEDHLHRGWQQESGLAEASLTLKRRLYVLGKTDNTQLPETKTTFLVTFQGPVGTNNLDYVYHDTEIKTTVPGK